MTHARIPARSAAARSIGLRLSGCQFRTARPIPQCFSGSVKARKLVSALASKLAGCTVPLCSHPQRRRLSRRECTRQLKGPHPARLHTHDKLSPRFAHGPHEGQYVEDYTLNHRRLWYMHQASCTAAHVRVTMSRLARRRVQHGGRAGQALDCSTARFTPITRESNVGTTSRRQAANLTKRNKQGNPGRRHGPPKHQIQITISFKCCSDATTDTTRKIRNKWGNPIAYLAADGRP